MNGKQNLYGMLVEFEDAEQLVRATETVRQAGYRRLNAYAPFPVEGLADALGFRRTYMPLVVLIGGIVGCAVGYSMQYWMTIEAYPLNIGGRPLHSWPSFIPVTFEMTILVAALSAVLGMLGLNGLPRPHHPLFAMERFAHASQDSFFLCILARDEKFDTNETRRFLESLEPKEVWDVPE